MAIQELRFFTPEGQLVLSPEEAAQQEQQQRLAAEAAVKAEQQRATEAEARNEKLATKLRELGIDPNTL